MLHKYLDNLSKEVSQLFKNQQIGIKEKPKLIFIELKNSLDKINNYIIKYFKNLESIYSHVETKRISSLEKQFENMQIDKEKIKNH